MGLHHGVKDPDAYLKPTRSTFAPIVERRSTWLVSFFQTRNGEQKKSYCELQIQHAVVLQKSEILKTELKEALEQNKVLAHEKWMLGQEKAQLYGQLKQLVLC